MARPPLLGSFLALLLAAFPGNARAQDWKKALEDAANKTSASPPPTRGADASAGVEKACVDAHPKCAELRALLEEALAFESEVDSCLAGLAACGAKFYDHIIQRDALIDRYNELARRDGPIMLWALIDDQGERLEKATPLEPVALATAEVKRLCRLAPPDCPQLTQELSDGTAALTGRRACGASPCGRAQLEAANQAHAAFFAAMLKHDFSQIKRRIELFSASKKAAPSAITTTLGAEFDALDETVTALEATSDGLKKRSERKDPSAASKLEALALQGQAALDELWAVSLSLDRSGSPLTIGTAPADDGGLVQALTAQRQRGSALALRLAALRDELIALQRRHGRKASARVDLSKLLPQEGAAAPEQLLKGMGLKGLKLPGAGVFGTNVPIGMESGPGVTAGAGSSLPAPIPGVTLSAPKKTLLDQTQVPKLAPRRKREDPPPILRESPCGFWDAWKCLTGRASTTQPEELVKADKLRRLGLTKTVGDPGAVDELVHWQEGSNTCAVVAQQQLLEVFGLGPKGDDITVEKTLASEAADKGFFKNGTPPEFSGNLLQSHGLIVVKHPGASVAELDAALKAGRILLVGVDAGLLWDNTAYLGGGHAILVTGAEALKGTGKILGYYVNDSGTGKGGWFVPAERFLKAWQAMGSFFAEVR